MNEIHENNVQNISMEFSIRLIDYYKGLTFAQKTNIINQLIRSGTAIGALIREAQGAESRKDFIHKMKIAYKEAEETEYWLILQQHTHPSADINNLLGLLIRIKQFLGKILTTCRNRRD